MSHDAKSAALIFRVISVLLLGYGLWAFLVGARFAAAIGASILYAPGVVSFAGGIVLFVAAPYSDESPQSGCLLPPHRLADAEADKGSIDRARLASTLI
jgi:hypothetical protein